MDKGYSLNEARNKAIEYAKDHHTDKSVVMTIASATNCKIDYNALEKKGDADMCTVFEETRAEGRKEGRAEGRKEGRAEEIVTMGCEFGLSESDILEQLQKKLNVSLEKAQEYFKMFREKTENVLCN